MTDYKTMGGLQVKKQNSEEIQKEEQFSERSVQRAIYKVSDI